MSDTRELHIVGQQHEGGVLNPHLPAVEGFGLDLGHTEANLHLIQVWIATHSIEASELAVDQLAHLV